MTAISRLPLCRGMVSCSLFSPPLLPTQHVRGEYLSNDTCFDPDIHIVEWMNSFGPF